MPQEDRPEPSHRLWMPEEGVARHKGGAELGRSPRLPSLAALLTYSVVLASLVVYYCAGRDPAMGESLGRRDLSLDPSLACGSHTSPPPPPPPEQRYCTYEQLSSPNTTYQWTAKLTSRADSDWGSEPPADDMELTLTPSGCQLRDFRDEVEEARRCMARAGSVVMVGDSLLRYQYLNLVHFLEHGVWEDRYPHLANEHEWGDDWERFFLESSTKRLNGQEICDCSRQDHGMQENRYYYSKGIRIALLFWAPMEPGYRVPGHALEYFMEPSSANETLEAIMQDWDERRGYRPEEAGRLRQKGCVPGKCRHADHPDKAWNHDIYGLLENFIPTLRPSVIVGLNSGLWRPLSRHDFDLERIFRAAVDALDGEPADKIYFKTTTAPHDTRGNAPVDDHGLSGYFRDRGARIYDGMRYTMGIRELKRSRLPHSLYWDDVHLTNEVYSELNKVLLNMMCNG